MAQQRISIHALREEGDSRHFAARMPLLISIHALREEGDLRYLAIRAYKGGISIHALREEGDVLFQQVVQIGQISIHALREEGDMQRPWQSCAEEVFLSTPSARRATRDPRCRSGGQGISIHALREEGDFSPKQKQRFCKYFYPRPPRGGRRVARPTIPQSEVFLSTPSARRATTFFNGFGVPGYLISIHALREEGDTVLVRRRNREGRFLSTPSARRATTPFPAPLSCGQNFYPRPPRGGRHDGVERTKKQNGDFYPRPPRGGRRHPGILLQRARAISIHALREEGDYSGPMRRMSSQIFLSTPSARRATFCIMLQ